MERTLPQDVSTWTVDHVTAWLIHIGIPEAIEQFRSTAKYNL